MCELYRKSSNMAWRSGNLHLMKERIKLRDLDDRREEALIKSTL